MAISDEKFEAAGGLTRLIDEENPGVAGKIKDGQKPGALTPGRRGNAFRVAPNSTRTLDLGYLDYRQPSLQV